MSSSAPSGAGAACALASLRVPTHSAAERALTPPLAPHRSLCLMHQPVSKLKCNHYFCG